MKTLKGWIATTCIALVIGTFTPAQASIIIGGRTNVADSCTDATKVETKSFFGSTTLSGLTSIIIGGLTSIIIGGVADDTPTQSCSIIIGG